MSKRVLIAGLFHETNTFLESVTSLDEFQVLQGSKLLRTEGDVSPLSGCLEFAGSAQWEVFPGIDLRAAPGGVVEDRVLEFFWDGLKAAVLGAGVTALSGVLLVLHGAMVTQTHDDVEGEILERLRGLLGPDTPVCAVLDLHANFTARMGRFGTALVAYRENPHADSKDAALRAARLLDRLMASGERPVTVVERPPIIWPPTGTATAGDPMRSLEVMAREIEAKDPHILAVNVWAGFAFSDVADAGLGFSAVTVGDPADAQRELSRLALRATEMRELGNRLDDSIDAVMRQISEAQEGPLIVAEPSDNIGAGAPGSGTGLLRAFVERQINRAVVVIDDAESVRRVRALRSGDRLPLRIGGTGSSLYPPPLALDVEPISTSDGRFDLEDARSHLASSAGLHIDMGPCAVVRHYGVEILLTSRRTPPFDLGQLRSQGIVPEKAFVIGVKAAVAHRRAYDPIARSNHSVDTPGPCSSNLKSYPYRKLRRPIYPLDLGEGIPPHDIEL